METNTKNNDTASEMGNSSRKNVTEEFRPFFIEELKDIYGAEKQLLDALPEMSEKAFVYSGQSEPLNPVQSEPGIPAESEPPLRV